MKGKQGWPQVSGARKLFLRVLASLDVNEQASLLASRNALFSNMIVYSNFDKGKLCVSLLIEYYVIIDTSAYRTPTCLSEGFPCLLFSRCPDVFK